MKYKVFLIPILLAAAASCVMMPEPGEEGLSSVLEFSAVVTNPGDCAATKGGIESVQAESDVIFLTTEEGEGGFCMSAETMFSEGAATRGSFIGSPADFRTDPGKFYASAFDTDAKSVWFTNDEVTYQSGKWVSPANRLWKKGKNYLFYAYANKPASGATISSTLKDGISLDYTLPTDPAAQKDILLGWYKGEGSKETKGKTTITFSHPLTGIVFKAGDFRDVKSIDRIELEGVYASGTCKYKEGQIISWNPGASKVTVAQTIGGSLASTGSQLGQGFILIPQNTASANVTLKLTYTSNLDGKQRVASAVISDADWTAGHTTVYTISYTAAQINLTVTAAPEAAAVKEISISNQSNQAAWIRAAVTGNWLDTSGAIVNGWDAQNEIVTVQGKSLNADWTYDATDGFYYYGKSVSPAESKLKAPFDEVGRPSADDGSHLELSFIVQGVRAAGYSSAKTAFTAK